MDYKNIILFDDKCNLCNATVAFILKNDTKAIFKFSSLHSNFSHNYLNALGFKKPDFNTMILIKNKTVYYRSTAWLQIFKSLGGLWGIMYVFIIIPRPIRDFIYNTIAKNRYKWFGKKKSCYLPTIDVSERFLA